MKTKLRLVQTSFLALCFIPISATGQSFSVDAVYGLAQKDLFDFKNGEKLDETDIYGVNIRFTQKLKSGIVLQDGQRIIPEFFGMLSLGTGDNDFNYEKEKVDAEILTASVVGGANLRWYLTDKFSLSCGAQLGVNYTSLTADWSFGTPTEKYSVGENSLGIVYGIGVGAEYILERNHAIRFGLDYIASTAQPKINIEYESQKMKKQSYAMFTIGYKYSF